MPLPIPDLDDRDFHQLLAEARRLIAGSCPGWTDLSPSDPGMMLVELFAHLTETMIYRLNRVPEKAYVEFLRLIGVKLRPPAAATAKLVFRLSRPARSALEVPTGTRVGVGRDETSGEAVVFATARPVKFAAGDAEAEVVAFHCEVVEAEAAGTGTGMPGQWLTLQRPPVVAPTGDGLDLIVGIETSEGELDERVPALRHGGKTYRVWREVDNFTNLGEDPRAYVCDRSAGLVVFAPAARVSAAGGALEERAEALAAVPPAGRDVRVWYRRGGGPAGNVAAHALTALKDPIAGVEVTNPEPATGGRAGEPLDNALVRGPQELHSLERAVTARDFELLAMRSSGAVARARALTQADLWVHARPGTVEVLLVPDLPAELRPGGRVAAAQLIAQETEEARRAILAALDERRPLGTACAVSWARYKAVRVEARVVVYRQEKPAAVKERVLERLHRSINPLPQGPGSPGWPFGQALRVSHVYDVVLAEPGVSYADRVRLVVDEVPEGEIVCLAADRFQRQTWYAGSGETLFRSLNDGDGWEPAGRFPGEAVERVAVHSDRAGLLAVATRRGEAEESGLYLSQDCGETWAAAGRLGFGVEDLTWILREGAPVLLLATAKGLYELRARSGATPVQVLVVAAAPDLGFYAAVAASDAFGAVNVAVAARQTGGVYLSVAGGEAGSFRKIGLEGEDVRALEVQADGPRLFLWAGAAAAGGRDSGRGCFSWELRGSADPPEGWQGRSQGWQGGSCHALAFQGSRVFAATHASGVLRLDAGKAGAAWEAPGVGSGLPLRDPGRFHPVRAVAADPDGRMLMAGSAGGVVRSRDGGAGYAAASSREFLDKVTLPRTWLACSGEHQIEVVSEDEAGED
jgi:Baseplate J-like protein